MEDSAGSSAGNGKRKEVDALASALIMEMEDGGAGMPGSHKRLKRQLTQESDLKARQRCAVQRAATGCCEAYTAFPRCSQLLLSPLNGFEIVLAGGKFTTCRFLSRVFHRGCYLPHGALRSIMAS